LVTPSVLELFETSLRDPALYQIGFMLCTILERYQALLPPHTRENLYCPGVRIESIDVGKLVTYFETSDAEITNAVYQNLHESNIIKGSVIFKSKFMFLLSTEVSLKHQSFHARQQRLNHKPYTITVHLESSNATRVVIRFFLGPKYNGKHDLLTLNDNRHNFFQLDQFVHDRKFKFL
jgi:hypothetical protein